MSRPVLVVVSGAPGSGKTTLAHRVAAGVGCPAICRDEIREGMMHAGTDDPGMRLALHTFFAAVTHLLRSGVTVVAESAFQDRLWRPGLEPLTALGTIRVLRCVVDERVARDRIVRRLAAAGSRGAHQDAALLRGLDDGSRSLAGWAPISLPVPTLTVDTTDGYDPPINDIIAYAAQPSHPV